MLKIDTEKIWKLLKKDKKIQKELLKYVDFEQRKLDSAKSQYQNQLEVIDELKEKQEKLSQERNKIDDQILRKNGEISLWEIKKMMTERRMKKLNRFFQSATTLKEQDRIKKKLNETQEEISEYEKNQLEIRSSIQNLEREKESIFDQKRDLKDEMDQNLDLLEEYSHSVSIWQEQVTIKESRFYQACFEEVTGYFKPCQDLVVPDLEESKKMSKEEAKKKANPIIIDEEHILSSPDQIKVRKLTKEEKEKYRRAA